MFRDSGLSGRHHIPEYSAELRLPRLAGKRAPPGMLGALVTTNATN
jgi:hypothetical protein